MKNGIWEWLEGVLLLEVCGNVSVFLAKVSRTDLELWDVVQISENSIRLMISMRHFLRLPHPFLGCEVRVVRRFGLPVLLRSLNGRKFFVIGAFAFLIALNILSLFVWQIEIRGNERVHSGQITRTLSEAGLQIGVPLFSIERESIKETLQHQFASEVTWINVTVKGSKVIIDLVERPEPFEARSGDIFALESGIITQIHVQQGEALYRSGVMVRQGDPLVLGYQRDSLGRYQPLRAEAQIQARVWRQEEETVAYDRVWYESTGLSMRITWLCWGEYSWPLGSAEIPYIHYRVERKPKSLFFDLHWLNFEIFDIIYTELSELNEKLTPEEAEQRATENALLRLAERMPAGSRLQSEQREAKHHENGVTVRLIWESLEEIGTLVPHR